MSTAEILKSMKNAPKLEKSTYNSWCTHFSDILSLFNVEDFILTEKSELACRNVKPVTADHLSVCRQDKNIRIAISQLVPDIAFHLVDSSYTSKQCWDNLRQFYCPNLAEDVDDLLQNFWSLTFEDDVDVDELVQRLAEIRGKISLIDKNATPSESSMKKRLVSHFIKCCRGFFMSIVVTLKDPSISFQSAVSSIRASQEVYREIHPTPIIALVGEQDGGDPEPIPYNIKTCAYCKRRGHIRERCFLWLETPDGTKWAAKNPREAAAARKLQEKVARRKRRESSSVTQPLSKINDDTMTSQPGAWVMEEHGMISHEIKDSDIVLDTGATNHIFHDRTKFFSVAPCEKYIVSASGQRISVSGVGKVSFKVFDYKSPNLSKVITMENVWFVPSCTKNLVSGIQLLSKGYAISTVNGGLSVLSSNGNVIATARPKGGLFCFNTNPSLYSAVPLPSSPDNCEILISQNVQKSATDLIHHRFAHVGSHFLKRIDVSRLSIPIIKKKDIPTLISMIVS